MGFEVYLQLYFASLYNLRNASFKDFAEKFSIVVSVIWQVLLNTLLIAVVVVLFTFKKKYKEEEIKDSKVRILLEEFKDNKKHLIIDHIIFMLRRILLSVLIIYGWGHGIYQSLLFLLIWIGVLISKILLRPFKNWILNMQQVIFEFILWVVIGILSTFYDKSTEFSESKSANLRGMIWFGLVWSLMIISHIITLILLVSNCISKKEPKKESSDVLPKGQENNQNSHKENSNLTFLTLIMLNFNKLKFKLCPAKLQKISFTATFA